MNKFDKLVIDLGERGDTISPLMPNANWISLNGNFTPDELKTIARKIESQFNKKG